MPVAATQHTAAGAKAFAEFFIKTIDWGFATVDAAYLRHYSTSECSSCRTLAVGMDADRSAGNRYIGGRLTTTATAIRRSPATAGGEYTAAVTFDVLAFEKVTKSGKFLIGEGAHRADQFEVSIHWDTGGWSVLKLAVNT